MRETFNDLNRYKFHFGKEFYDGCIQSLGLEKTIF
jgi:hypothetical protein